MTVPFHRHALFWLKGRPVIMRIALALAALVILPYVLIVLYLLPFVHPVSTLMLRDLVLLRGYDRVRKRYGGEGQETGSGNWTYRRRERKA